MIKSSKRGIEAIYAYCTVCKWRVHTETVGARSSARYHVKKTGHEVDVYTESRSRIKEVQE